jgi:hypothetical protein
MICVAAASCAPMAGCGPDMSCDTSSVTLTYLKTNVFGSGIANPKSCTFSSCHDAEANPQGMLNLQTDPYTALVNATPSNMAAQAKGWKRVVPGDLGNSYLHYKLNLPQSCDPGCPDQTTCMVGPSCLGLRMPNTGQTLDACTLSKIDAWITAGAKND